MKKILVWAVMLMACVNVAMAEKTTVFHAEMSCGSCVNKIMSNVPSLGKGIKDVKADLASQTVTVTYDELKNNDANILKGLNSLKVNAKLVDNTPHCVMPAVTPDAQACAAAGSESAPKHDCCSATKDEAKKNCAPAGERPQGCCQVAKPADVSQCNSCKEK